MKSFYSSLEKSVIYTKIIRRNLIIFLFVNLILLYLTLEYSALSKLLSHLTISIFIVYFAFKRQHCYKVTLGNETISFFYINILGKKRTVLNLNETDKRFEKKLVKKGLYTDVLSFESNDEKVELIDGYDGWDFSGLNEIYQFVTVLSHMPPPN